MNFDIPIELSTYLSELDIFIAEKIKPLEEQDDNVRFFDHRREYSRTDWELEEDLRKNGKHYSPKRK